MKGIILSGGEGTRLRPLTRVTSKQLLPIYNKPMIFYPLQKLLDAGIKEILIIVAPDHCGEYMKVLGSGKEFGARFTYEIQDEPLGIAHAFIVAENFIENDSVALILGDNLFDQDFTEAVQTFKSGGRVFAVKVSDPERFGQILFDDSGKAIKAEEKPKVKLSDYIVPGFYIFDNRVSTIAKSLKPSARRELEVPDVQQWYIDRGELDVKVLQGAWFDAGTFETLHKANIWAYQKINRQ